MRRHRNAVYRLVRGHVGDPDEALDLTQECFATAYRALAQFEVDRSLRGWLARIAINKCRDWSRRRMVRRFFAFAAPLSESIAETIEDPAPGPHRDVAGREEARRLWAAIATLSPTMKEPLLLSAMEGLSHAEVAAVLSISEKAVESRLYRARKKLAALLDDG
ncbi:MAG: RNA polymerase sigma factor [Sphingopyxis sp.]|nr:RNA polymerase sigma factor [Sphingopyxis sp.]